MKRVSIAVAVLVALTLTGCAGGPEEVGDERTTSVATESATAEETATPSPEVSAAPITASPEPSDLPSAPATPEEEFVAAAQNYLNGWGYWDFTDEQLLGAGLYACESSDPTVEIIEGIGPVINADLVSQARTILCP